MCCLRREGVGLHQAPASAQQRVAQRVPHGAHGLARVAQAHEYIQRVGGLARRRRHRRGVAANLHLTAGEDNSQGEFRTTRRIGDSHGLRHGASAGGAGQGGQKACKSHGVTRIERPGQHRFQCCDSANQSQGREQSRGFKPLSPGKRHFGQAGSVASEKSVAAMARRNQRLPSVT